MGGKKGWQDAMRQEEKGKVVGRREEKQKEDEQVEAVAEGRGLHVCFVLF